MQLVRRMSKSYRAKLTPGLVKSLKTTGEDFCVNDTEVRGFHVRITPSGHMAFRLRYQKPSGSRGILTLGQTSAFGAGQARQWAKYARLQIEMGIYPADPGFNGRPVAIFRRAADMDPRIRSAEER